MRRLTMRKERKAPEKACKPGTNPGAGPEPWARADSDCVTVLAPVRVSEADRPDHHAFPHPRPSLPAWLLTAHVTPTPAQLARLDEALAAVDDQGRRVRVRPIYSERCA